jgi:hypothetical protein
MVRSANIYRSLGLWMLMTAAAPAAAQTFRHTEMFLSSAAEHRVVTFLGARAAPTAAAKFDYALFAAELIAYLTKEVLPESADEYENSSLGSHLSTTMPPHRSEFGSHCLEVVTRLGSAMPAFGGNSAEAIGGPPSTFDYAARAGSLALALHQVWAALRNEVESSHRGLSLNPKVSARRFAVNLTLRW